MSGTALERWSPLSGLVFVALFLAGSIVFDSAPSIGASDAAIVDFYEDGGNQVKLQSAYLAVTLAAVFFVWFVGVLSAHVRRSEAEPAWLSRIVVVSGAASITVLVIGFLSGGMVIDIGDDTTAYTVDPDTVRLLTDAYYTFVFETALPLAAPMVLAVSVAALRSRLLPRWLGWAGCVVAASCLVGFLGVPMGLFLLWTVLVGVYLTRRLPPERTALEAGPP